MAKLNSLRYLLKNVAINISLGIYFDTFRCVLEIFSVTYTHVRQVD